MKTSTLRILAYILIGLGFLVAILYTFAGHFIYWSWSIDAEKSAQYGTFMSGIVGTVFSLSGILLLIENLRQQRIDTDKQQFETAFFNMLSIMREIVNHASGSVPKVIPPTGNFIAVNAPTQYGPSEEFDGLDFYTALFQYFDGLKNFPDYRTTTSQNLQMQTAMVTQNPNTRRDAFFIKYVAQKGHVGDIYAANFSNEKDTYMVEYPVTVYNHVYNKYTGQLSHFFRYLFNIIKFTIDSRSKYEDEAKYINLLQAQLSSDQLGLLFYNVLSINATNSAGLHEFHNLLDKYNFFQNIDSDNLLNNDDDIFYPNTTFKYKRI